jgi:hypothetical protein
MRTTFEADVAEFLRVHGPSVRGLGELQVLCAHDLLQHISDIAKHRNVDPLKLGAIFCTNGSSEHPC